MKTVFNKTLLAAALATSLGVASTNTMAVAFPDFTVDEGSVAGTLPNIFIADKITGNYVEVATFGAGTFDISIRWNAGQFVANDGTTAVTSQLGSFGANGYGLYALFQGTGTFSTVAGITTSTFTPGGSLRVYIDPLQNTTFTAPGTGLIAWATGLNLDDYEIGNGTPQSGTGTLNPALPTCVGGGINCGSFGATTSFALTGLPQNPNGKQYFTVPNPFYNLSFQSGQFNNFTPVGTQTINGSLDVVFGNSVPEPATLALLGLGLMGMGAVARRRKAA